MNIFLLMLPLLLIVLSGYCSARFSLLSEESNEYFTKFAFFIAMPCQLFFDFAKTPVSQSINVPYILDFVISMSITAITVFAFSKYIFKKTIAESALNVMASSMVNTAYFAIPLFLLIFNNPTPVLPILIFQVAVLTPLILLVIEYDVSEKVTKKEGYYFQKIKSTFLIILKNPVILASLLGVFFSLFGLLMPNPINKFLKLMGETAAPLVLFALGQSLFFDIRKPAGKELIEISFLSIIKLLILPALAFLVGKHVFKLDTFWLSSLVLMAAMPSPKNMFIFAVRYKLDVKKASTVIAVTTLLSFITLNVLLILM